MGCGPSCRGLVGKRSTSRESRAGRERKVAGISAETFLLCRRHGTLPKFIKAAIIERSKEMVSNMMSSARRKPYKGMAMEGLIARWYAKNTTHGRGYREIAQAISERLAPGSEVLEVAPGPGYLAIELARPGSYHILRQEFPVLKH